MWQEIPGTQLDLPTLSTVAHWILDRGYLSGEDISNLMVLNPVFAAPYLLDLPISRPWSPVRKRIWGFGKVHKYRHCGHDRVNPRSMIHFVWSFLTPQDRFIVIRTFPQWKKYAELRLFAASQSISHLRAPKPMLEAGIPKRLDPVRARKNSACLLRFDFLHEMLFGILMANMSIVIVTSMLNGR
jgi:hypothetical protein